MNARLVQTGLWLCLYLVLLAGRQRLEHWLLARFQRRRGGAAPRVPHRLPHRYPFHRGEMLRTFQRSAHVLATATFLAAGAAIPLGPALWEGEWAIAPHLFGEADASLIYVLALHWIGAGLLRTGERSRRAGDGLLETHVARLFASSVPALLIVLSLTLTSGALSVRQEGTLSMTGLIATQGGWHGVRWMAVLQPAAFVLWIGCWGILRPRGRARVSLAWQAQALNYALLTGALFLGGWQGPGVSHHPGLGLLYTALKAAIVTLVQVWVWASRPEIPWIRQARSGWQVYVPLAAANVVLTILVCAQVWR